MSTFWDSFWLIAEVLVFVAYIFVLLHNLADVFRNHEMSGFVKALWILGLILPIPFIAVIYILWHGRGMAQRQQQAMERAKSNTDSYIRQIAGKSPADQISEAKVLLNAGTITADEFAQLKAKALA